LREAFFVGFVFFFNVIPRVMLFLIIASHYCHNSNVRKKLLQ